MFSHRAVIFLFIILFGGVFVLFTLTQEDRERRAEFLRNTLLTAEAITPERLEDLQGNPQDEEKASVRNLMQQLRSVLLQTENGACIYLSGLNADGDIIYLLHVNAEERKHHHAHSGEVEQEASSEFRALFQRNSSPLIEGPLPREGENWVRALVPIPDPDSGEVSVVLGIDVPASDWQDRVMAAATFPILLAVTMLLGWVLGILILSRIYKHNPEASTWLVETLLALFTLMITAAAILFTVHRFERFTQQGIQLRSATQNARAISRELKQFEQIDLKIPSDFFNSSSDVTPEDFQSFTENLLEHPLLISLSWIGTLPIDIQPPLPEALTPSDPRPEDLPNAPIRLYASLETEPGIQEAQWLNIPQLPALLEQVQEEQLPRAWRHQEPGRYGGAASLWVASPLNTQNGLKQLQGSFLAAEINLSHLIQSVLAQDLMLHDTGNIWVGLFLANENGSLKRLAMSPPPAAGDLLGDSIRLPVFVFGQSLFITVEPIREQRGPGPLALISALTLIAVSLATAAVAGIILHRRDELKEEVALQTRSLQESEQRLSRINLCLLDFTSNPDSNIHKLTELCASLFESDAAMYFRKGEEGLRMMSSSSQKARQAYEQLEEDSPLLLELFGSGLSAPQIRSDLPENDPASQELSGKLILAQSISTDDRDQSCLCLLWSSNRTISHSEMEAFTAITAALRIEEARAATQHHLHERDRLLEASAFAGNMLLAEDDLDEAIIQSLSLIGIASRQDRVYLFEFLAEKQEGQTMARQRSEWCRDGITAQMNDERLQAFPFERSGFSRWITLLSEGRFVEGLVRDFPPEEQQILEEQDIRSILVVPVNYHNQLWGFIGFDNCSHDHIWSGTERSILVSIASAIGSAIEQKRSEDKLQQNNIELNKAVKQAQESVVEAERANAAKSEFLARMSHEIRTPMNGILGMSRILRQQPLSHEQSEYIGIIIHSAEQLMHIINDILDFSKIEAGKLSLSEEDFNLKQLMDSIHHLLSVKAIEKNLSYHPAPLDSIPLDLRGDPLRLRQILMNLIGNAIKFTDTGIIRSKVECLVNTRDQIRLRFSVQDSGIGIPEDQIATLFEEFTQLDGSSARRFEGTGLGLSIVRKLLDLMGGNLNVTSEPGKGSIFSFEVPLLPAHAPEQLHMNPAPEPEPREALPTATQVTVKKATVSTQDEATSSLPAAAEQDILLAEDNLVNQKVASLFLKKLGLSCHIVGNGSKAVEALQKHSYRMVLMDVHMPEMDGLEATRNIRKNEAQLDPPHRTPIIALTADAIKGDREKCIEAGMDDYLTKPLQQQGLKEMIDKHILS